MKKLIKQTERYIIYEVDYEGLTLIFRQWNNGTVEMNFSDAFCMANGYKNKEDMLNTKGLRESLILTCGNVPDWITVDYNEGFVVKNTQNDLSFN